MNPKDDDFDEGKICPQCRKTVLSHSTRNKHMQNYVCHKSLSRTSVSSRNSPSFSYPAPRGPPDGTHLPVYYTSLSHCTIPSWIWASHWLYEWMNKLYLASCKSVYKLRRRPCWIWSSGFPRLQERLSEAFPSSTLKETSFPDLQRLTNSCRLAKTKLADVLAE